MDRSSSVFLTKREVDAVEARDERYHLWDTKLAGFGLRVEKSGTKTFVARYRADGGGRTAPRRFITIGRFGVLTVEEARKQARMLLGAAAKGDDPASERRGRRREMTMSAPVDLYGGLLRSAGHPARRTDEGSHQGLHDRAPQTSCNSPARPQARF